MAKHVETLDGLVDSEVGDWTVRATNTGSDQPMRLLSVQELADFLQVPVQTIYGWRKKGDGPKGLRIGRHLRFIYTDVLKWLERRAG